MKLLDFFRRKPAAQPKASDLSSPDDWLMNWLWSLGAPPSDSGIEINGKTALNYSSVFQATNVICGDLACAPLNVYERTDNGKEIDVSHPAQQLCRHRANSMMNSFVHKRLCTQHGLLWGMGRSLIQRDRRGWPIALVPLLPDRTVSEVEDGKLWHLTKLGDSPTYNAVYRDDDVLVIPGLSFDGINGYSVITLARNSWGLGLACEKHANTAFKNGVRPSVVLKATGARVPEDHVQQLLADWNRWHAGLDNVGRTGFLQPGMELDNIPAAMSSVDLQFLETRVFQRDEVASWFNLPAYKLNSKSQDGYNSTEMRAIEYVNGCLQHWFTAWTEECRDKLLTEQEKQDDSHFFAFDLSQLLRGTLKDRYAAYLVGRQGEWLSADEIRRMENLNDRPDDQLGEYVNPFTKGRPAGEDDRDIEPDQQSEEPIPTEKAG